MKRPSVVVLVAAGALAVAASTIQAGPEKIAFPANYKDHVLYATLDRYDTKQYRELYGTPEAVRAAKEGKPIPSGSVLTLVQYKAQVDAQGNPVKDANGRFVKGELVAFTVMEKRAGWGAEYPDDLRNGEWEYSAFTAEGKFNDKANFKGCFQCHKPHEPDRPGRDAHGRERREHRRVRLRAEQAHGRARAVGHVDERGRLASPDRVPEDPGAFPRAAQGPEPHADVSHAWHL